jgi:predicted dehydrogenase
LFDTGYHPTDRLLHLSGSSAAAVRSTMGRYGLDIDGEDTASVQVRFASGAIGVIDATTTAYPGSAERIDLVGTKGTASLAGTALTVAYHDGQREQIAADASAGGTGADPMPIPHDYPLGLWRDFLDAIEQKRPPRISGEEGLKVHRLIDALLAAGDSSGKVAVVQQHAAACLTSSRP